MLLKGDLVSSHSHFLLIIANCNAAACNLILNGMLWFSDLYSKNSFFKKYYLFNHWYFKAFLD